MDQVSEQDTATDVVRRRKLMRAAARGLRVVPPRGDEYQTPEWLDRSFVLPLRSPEVTEVARDSASDIPSDFPSQTVPHHDDDQAALVEAPVAEPQTDPEPVFVRPATPEIDFAKVIRRADLSRSATRMAMAATGITGLVLIGYLLTSSPVVLGMAISFALVALGALAVRVRLAAAGIPHLDR